MKTDPISRKFVRDGWLLMDLAPASARIVKRVQSFFLKRLADQWHIRLRRLEDYHKVVTDDDLNTRIQTDFTEWFQVEGYGRQIIAGSLDGFRKLLGPDLHVQKYPYVRIARPGLAQDNIGIHRDTHYGCSPYEVSVSIPFTDVPAKGALGVLTGSHIIAESELPVTQISSGIDKGSTKHKLGFLYAPKVMSSEVRSKVKPVRVAVGKALIFSLSLVHGQEINRSQNTRITTDIRLVNSFAPIAWSRNVHGDYYEPLCASPVAEQARQYLAANQTQLVTAT